MITSLNSHNEIKHSLPQSQKYDTPNDETQFVVIHLLDKLVSHCNLGDIWVNCIWLTRFVFSDE